jgi:hypothetical protein
MILWIIGHWGSCNMGDKFQPYVIANSILKENDSFGNWENPKNIYFVNFSNHNNMFFKVNNEKYTINGPSDDIPKADFAILTTGSMDHNSPYINWIKDYLEKQTINKLIIWGGFNRADYIFEDFKIKMNFLRNKKIIFIARSERDLKLYEEISGNIGILGGDPMCYWVTEEGIEFGNKICNDENIDCDNKTIVIPSKYCFMHNKKYWEELCNKCDIIICIDSFADNEIIKKYKDKSYVMIYPWIFSKIIKNAKHTINGRLHSFVISACSHVPTTVIVTDGKPCGTGTFKFEAVCNTAVGHGKSLSDIVLKYEKEVDELLENIPNNIYDKNVEEYVKITMKSLDMIKILLNFF